MVSPHVDRRNMGSRTALLLVGTCLVVCANIVHAKTTAISTTWQEDVRRILSEGVENRAFPGAVAAVRMGSGGETFFWAVGRHRYDPDAIEMSVNETIFDLASLTKVTATTTSAMLLYQQGHLSIHDDVAALFPEGFVRNDERKSRITVLHLLLHTAGFPPDPTPVSFCAPSFGCPETHEPPEDRRLTFSCLPRAYKSILAQKLDRLPGEAFVYSDISMITLSFVIGFHARTRQLVSNDDLRRDCVDFATRATATRADSEDVEPIDQCFFEAFARRHVFEHVLQSSLHRPRAFFGFRPDTFVERSAPTWNDTEQGFPGECVRPFRQRVLQGEVSDGNAFAMGGVAGHAGVFAGVRELVDFLGMILYASEETSLGITADTAKRFTTVWNASQSSRALGWDTNNYVTNTYRGCGNFSNESFTHTGYTGTQLCADPVNDVMTVLLTNRVYPRADNESKAKIHHYRQEFNNAVFDAVRIYFPS